MQESTAECHYSVSPLKIKISDSECYYFWGLYKIKIIDATSGLLSFLIYKLNTKLSGIQRIIINTIER